MNLRSAIMSLGLASFAAILMGCASRQVVLAPVGPCSTKQEASDLNGHLRVFSLMEAQSEGDDPIWYQHSAYFIYNEDGKRFKYVGNTIGKWDETPETLTLPAGRYTVKARAEGALLAEVPVVIERGKTTGVHLESGWSAAPGPPGTEIVHGPSGYAVGWRSSSSLPSSGE